MSGGSYRLREAHGSDLCGLRKTDPSRRPRRPAVTSTRPTTPTYGRPPATSDQPSTPGCDGHFYVAKRGFFLTLDNTRCAGAEALLLTDRSCSPRTFDLHTHEREERMCRVRIVATAVSVVNARYTPEARYQRLHMGDRMRPNLRLAPQSRPYMPDRRQRRPTPAARVGFRTGDISG